MKYRKCIRKPNALPKECSAKHTGKFHSLSYYLNGGIDLTGDAVDNSAEVEYDNAEQMKEIIEEGASSVAYGDPRESKFSLVERYGSHEAKAMASKSAKLSDNGTDNGTDGSAE